MKDFDSIWRIQDEIRRWSMLFWVRSALPLATEGTQECIWNLSYNERRMAIELVKYAEIPNYCDVKCLTDGISSLMVLQ